MNQIEKAANTRMEQVVKSNEVELNDPLAASRSVQMLTAIHDLETANIKVDRIKKKNNLPQNPGKNRIKIKKKEKFSLFGWIKSLFSK